MKRALFELRQNLRGPHDAVGKDHSGWQAAMDVMVLVQRQTHLAKIVGALDAPGGFAGCLYRRQEQSYQNADDRDDDQQLDDGECRLSSFAH